MFVVKSEGSSLGESEVETEVGSSNGMQGWEVYGKL